MKNITLAGIPSGPEDFLIAIFASTLLTSLVRIWISGIVQEARGKVVDQTQKVTNF